MESMERQTALRTIQPPQTAAGEWYLNGFEDAYRGRPAVTPVGPAGDQYSKGYAEGLAAVQRDFFAQTWQ